MQRAHGKPVIIQGSNVLQLQRVEITSRHDGGLTEEWLQNLIHEHPSVLPLEQIEPAFLSPISICMEMPTKHGPIDNLLLTPDGDIVIVETKLWRNSEARRKVVAQALDYASCLFEMDYAELQAAVLRGSFGKGQKPATLYAAVADRDPLTEAQFEDAINVNLRSGRVVILIVGDGIRTEVERLSGILQSHGGFHFTLALVELAIYALPGNGYLVHPQTLARTVLIERGVVRVEDPRVRVTLPALAAQEPAHGGISEEQFLDAMKLLDPTLPDRLTKFLGRIAQMGVYPVYQKSLNLRVDSPSGKSVNLGTIYRQGQVWTDAVNGRAPMDLAHMYNERLAAVLGMDVEKHAFKENWHIRQGGKAPKIVNLKDRLDIWAETIEWFVRELRKIPAEDS